ncbi:MAG TPA: hypothetical protein DIU14_04395, partial [Actinobacteria bacterium]|nr:hypothetical protein [Actinomycetota bacterium]
EAGVQLRYEGSAPGDKRITGRRQVMHKAVAEAADLYAGMLKDGREAAEARGPGEGPRGPPAGGGTVGA